MNGIIWSDRLREYGIRRERELFHYDARFNGGIATQDRVALRLRAQRYNWRQVKAELTRPNFPPGGLASYSLSGMARRVRRAARMIAKDPNDRDFVAARRVLGEYVPEVVD